MPFKNNRNSRDDKSQKSNHSSSKGSGHFKPQTGKFNKRNDEMFPGGSERTSSGTGRRDNEKKENPDFDRDRKPTFDKKFTKPGIKKFGSTDNRKPWVDRKERTDEAGGGQRPDQFRKNDQGRPYKKEFKPRFGSENRKWSSEETFKNVRSKRITFDPVSDGLIRLNRYISNAGICSRRKADELIQAGVVSVNGEVVSELGYKVDPQKDVIRYNGETLKREKMVYVLLNKPKDYITTTDDPHERRTVMQLVEKASKERIYPVGRLDRNTTGLLLMTNDGDLAEKLSHPRSNITKIYNVELNKSLSQGDLNKIAYGVELEDGLIKPDSVSYVQGGSKREVGIQIHSGKNRIIRRIFEHLGYEVVKLDRVIYANLTKKDLGRGRWRYLDEKEVIQLKHLIKT